MKRISVKDTVLGQAMAHNRKCQVIVGWRQFQSMRGKPHTWLPEGRVKRFTKRMQDEFRAGVLILPDGTVHDLM